MELLLKMVLVKHTSLILVIQGKYYLKNYKLENIISRYR